MSEEQSDNIELNSPDILDKDFEEIFNKARTMNKFKMYDDYELKEKLVNLVFSINQESVEDIDEPVIEEEKSDEEKEKHINTVISLLEDSVVKEERLKNYSRKKKIITKKNITLGSLKEQFPLLFDMDSVNRLLFKLAKEVEAYHKSIFWDFTGALSPDIKQFRREAALSLYDEDNSFFVKIWDLIIGQKNDKIEKQDPFNNMSFSPKESRKNLYGINYFKSKSNHEGWANLCFGSVHSPPDIIPLDDFYEYGMKDIFQSMSKNFDEIFEWANVKFYETENEKEIQQLDNLVNEGLLFKLISENFMPIIRIFSVFEHITDSLPLTENHLLKPIHLLYFVAYVYYKYFNFIEKTYYDKKNYVTPEGETGIVSLHNIFFDIKSEMDHELVSVDPDKNLEQFHDYFVEREEILKKIDYFTNLLPEIKLRLKLLLSSLMAETYADYAAQKGCFFKYHIDQRGKLIFDHLVKEESEGFFNKIASLFKSNTEEIEKTETSTQFKPKQTATSKTKRIEPKISTVNITHHKDYSDYSRLVDDLLTLLTSIIHTFNENFSDENHFLETDDKENRYDYLLNNPHFNNEEKISFDAVKNLQDYFNLMYKIKKVGEKLIESIKNFEEIIEIRNHSKDFDELLSQFITFFKDSSGTLGLLTENKDKYQEYGVLFNKFYFVHAEFKKVGSNLLQ